MTGLNNKIAREGINFKEYNGDLNKATPGMLIRTGFNTFSDVVVKNLGEGMVETFYSVGNYEGGLYGIRKMKKTSNGFDIFGEELLPANFKLKINERTETAKNWAYLSQRFQVFGRK
jgi:hypothetical protein